MIRLISMECGTTLTCRAALLRLINDDSCLVSFISRLDVLIDGTIFTHESLYSTPLLLVHRH